MLRSVDRLALLLAAGLSLGLSQTARAAEPPDGAALYKQRCAACHDAPDASTRAPSKAVLATRAPADIVTVLKTGGMSLMASGLSDPELAAVAAYVTGKAPAAAPAAQTAAAAPVPAAEPNLCKTIAAPGVAGPRWNGWSPDLANTRFQAAPGLTAAQAPKLKVKWSFLVPGGVASQPTVVGGRVYVAAGGGRAYALDARTGCTLWRADVSKSGVRAAMSVGPLSGPRDRPGRLAVFVADRGATVHALDAATGKELWSNKVETHPMAMITGSPVLHGGRLYVPLSSAEELGSVIPNYVCCRFRGSVVALDPATGAVLWRTYVTPEESKPWRVNAAGKQIMGPAGAAIWSAPTIDPKRGVLYVATGDSYTDAPNSGSDAVIAMDLVSGAVRWSHQVTANDNYMVGCTGNKGQPANCPDKVGPDHDFGASPVLATAPDGRAVILAGQKSGEVTAFDPDHGGQVLWRKRIGLGSALGGVEWGLASDGKLLFVPIADPYTPKEANKGGLFALNIGDGAEVWAAPAPAADCAVAPKGSQIEICTSGLSAAATAMPGLVVAGSMDGYLRAYGARDGKVLWDFNVGGASFQPVNAAAPVKGGTMNGPGATIAGGILYHWSGYSSINPAANSLLLAFSVDGK